MSHLLRAARRLVLVVPMVLALAPPSAHAAAELAILPEEVDFGAHPAGAAADRTVTIRNLGPDTTALSEIFIAGPGVDQFDFVDGGCVLDAPLAAAAECQLTLRFSTASGSSGSFEAFLGVEGGPDDVPAAARLTGSVASGGGLAQLLVDPRALHFSSTPLGTVSPPQQITVRNVGTGQANDVALQVRSSSFDVTNGCPPALAPGAECAVTVAFAPRDLSSGSNNSALRVSWAGGFSASVRLAGAAARPPDPYAATERILGDLVDVVPKALRGGPRSIQLPLFRAPAAGTLKLQVYGWARGVRILVASGSQALASGTEHRLRARSTKKGRKLLRRPQQTRIKVVLSYVDQATGKAIKQAPEYRVKAPKVKRLAKAGPKKKRRR